MLFLTVGLTNANWALQFLKNVDELFGVLKYIS